MSAQMYEAKARKHWSQWLPKRVAELKKAGELDRTLQTVGKQAQARVLELMKQGFQQHEAEEVALSELINLPPEPDAVEAPWEKKEIAALDREYHRKMGA